MSSSRAKKKIVRQKSPGEIVSKSIALKAGTPFFILALLHVVAAFFPNERLWGLNHFAFLPDWLIIVPGGLSVLCCTLFFYPAYRFAAKILFSDKKITRVVFPIALVIISAFIFWTLRMHTYFLGDGAVYLGEMFRYTKNQPISPDMLFGGNSSPLTGWMYATLGKTIIKTTSIQYTIFSDTRVPFRLVGTILGCCFVFFASIASRALSPEPENRLGYFFLLLSSSGVIFYFGYVEYYAPVFTVLAVYFFLSITAHENKTSVIVLVGVLLLATAFHYMAIVAHPSLILILLYRSLSEPIKRFLSPGNIIFTIIAILCLAIGYYVFSGMYARGSRNVISLLPVGVEETLQQYTLLSSYHLIDFINLLILLAAPLIIIAACVWKKEYFNTPAVVVSFVNLFFFFCLAFFGYASFGLARDWDINAVLGLSSLFFVIALLRGMHDGAKKKYFLYLTSGASICGALAWFAVNIDSSSSVERYKSILALDAHHIPRDGALNGYEHLRKWYLSEQRNEEELWAVRKKVELVGYPSDYRYVSVSIDEVVPFAKRKEYYDWVFEKLSSQIAEIKKSGRDSVHAGTMRQFEELAAENIIQCFYEPRETGTGENYARSELERMKALVPSGTVLRIAEAQMDFQRHPDVVTKEKFLRGGLDIQSSSILCMYAGKALITANELAPAKEILEKGYRIDSSAKILLYHLAYIEYVVAHDTTKVMRYMEEFLSDSKTEKLRQHGGPSEKNMIRNAEFILKELRNAKNK